MVIFLSSFSIDFVSWFLKVGDMLCGEVSVIYGI